MSSPTKSPKKPPWSSKTTPTKPKPTSPNSKPSSSKKNPITKINMTTSPTTKKMPKQVTKQAQPHPTALRATTAASSNVSLDRKLVRSLAQRSDLPGLLWLASWIVAIALSGYLLYLAQTLTSTPASTLLSFAAALLLGTILTVPSYAISHECAHGTAFRSRWINETCLWVGSLLYFEEPYHRRYSHTRHHTYTWHVDKDSQMPFDTPMTLSGWLFEISGVALVIYEAKVFARNALGKFSPQTLGFTPENTLGKLKWGARACILIYATLAVLLALGETWVWTYLLLPRLLGGPVMLLFTLLQHVELKENSPSILESTRSFTTSPIGRWLYMDMNNHIEHHLYPQVPFYALHKLRSAVANQVPAPDRGFWRSNWEVLSVVVRRSLGRGTKAETLRQAPRMIVSAASSRAKKEKMTTFAHKTTL